MITRPLPPLSEDRPPPQTDAEVRTRLAALERRMRQVETSVQHLVDSLAVQAPPAPPKEHDA